MQLFLVLLLTIPYTWASCSGGYYWNGNTCILCEVGYACNWEARWPCGPGSGYSDQSGLSSCKPCAWGYMSSTGCDPQSGACKSSSTCAICPQGTTSEGWDCNIGCPSGWYCPGNVAPGPCPAGYTCWNRISKTPCSLGSYCPPGSIYESPCPAGSICTSSASKVPCPAGYYCAERTTSTSSAQPCSLGSYCPEGSGWPSPCPAGSYCTNPTTRTLCPAGYYCLEGSTMESAKKVCSIACYCPEGTGDPIWCPAGTFSASTGLTKISDCSPCSSGQYCPPKSSAPAPCTKGYYCTSPDKIEPCPTGTWSDQTGKTSSSICQPCGFGFKQPLTAATSSSQCKSCLVGEYTTTSTASTCIACSIGFYAKSDKSGCLGCINGYFLDKAGDGVSSCIPCVAGMFTAGGQTSATTGNSVCSYCKAGLWSNAASTSCFSCEAGYYCPGDGTKNLCPPGSYCVLGSSAPTTCGIGTFNGSPGKKTLGDCQSCTLGNYCPTKNLTAPIPCQTIGAYCPSGSSMQTLCPEKSYCPTPSIIISCPIGSYCATGSTEAKPCPKGFYCPENSAIGTACTVGSYCPGSPPTLPSVINGVVSGFSQGAYIPGKVILMSKTPSGDLHDVFLENENTVSSGILGGSNPPVPRNETRMISYMNKIYIVDGFATTYQKSVWEYDGTWKTRKSVMSMMRYRFALVPWENCLLVIGGRTPTGLTDTMECWNISAPTSSSIILPYRVESPMENLVAFAHRGFLLITGGSSRSIQVFRLSYASTTMRRETTFVSSYNTYDHYTVFANVSSRVYIYGGNTFMDVFNDGVWSTLGGAPVRKRYTACQMSHWLIVAGGVDSNGTPLSSIYVLDLSPELDPTWTLSSYTLVTPQYDLASSCSIYAFYSGRGHTGGGFERILPSCNAAGKCSCPAGYTPGPSSSNCTISPVGSYALFGSTSYSPCDVSKRGKYCPAGSRHDQPCMPGHYCPQADTATRCPVGTYRDSSTAANSSTHCTLCFAGTYQPLLGASLIEECIACPVGKTSSAGASNCTTCTIGSYCPGGVAETICPSGFYCPYGSISPLECPLGHQCPSASMITPSACDWGTFQNKTGQTVCIDCPLGHRCENLAMSTPSPCTLGSYQDNLKQSTCKICPMAHKCNSTKMYNPVPCGIGEYQNETGQSSCQTCLKGHYCSMLRLEQPIACPPGRYQVYSGQSNCLSCTPGTYSAKVGAYDESTCRLCSQGHFSKDGQSYCNTCEPGSFSTMKGAASCMKCPPGYYQSSNAGTSCTRCRNYNSKDLMSGQWGCVG